MSNQVDQYTELSLASECAHFLGVGDCGGE
jgi:hypothetical protein